MGTDSRLESPYASSKTPTCSNTFTSTSYGTNTSTTLKRVRAPSIQMAKMSSSPLSEHALTLLDCPRWRAQDRSFGFTRLHGSPLGCFHCRLIRAHKMMLAPLLQRHRPQTLRRRVLESLGLMKTLCPFQLFYSDGVERLDAESARERVHWVGAIWYGLGRLSIALSQSHLRAPCTIRPMASASTNSNILNKLYVATALRGVSE